MSIWDFKTVFLFKLKPIQTPTQNRGASWTVSSLNQWTQIWIKNKSYQCNRKKNTTAVFLLLCTQPPCKHSTKGLVSESLFYFKECSVLSLTLQGWKNIIGTAENWGPEILGQMDIFQTESVMLGRRHQRQLVLALHKALTPLFSFGHRLLSFFIRYLQICWFFLSMEDAYLSSIPSHSFE